MTLPLILAFSLGVHVLAFLSLGLVAEGNEQVRAYRRFVGVIALWLVLALLTALDIGRPISGALSGAVAHFLPVIFLVAGGLPLRPLRSGAVTALLAVAAVALPFTMDVSPWHHRGLEIAYYVLAWGAVGFRVRQAFRVPRPAPHRRRRRVIAGLLIGGPLTIGVLVAFGALAAIPLLAAAVQGLVLYATVRLSLYEVRAGASRTGTLAADAAEHDRRAVVGEIAAMVAHEVRNPLTGIRSLAQRLADDAVDQERRQRYATVIVREVDRVERMVGALLGAVARPPRSDGTAETRVGELVEDVALLVSGRFRRAGVALTVEPSSLVVAAPREPLAQVLLNLLLNAVAQAPAQRGVRVHSRAEGANAVMSVEDHGPGVPEQDREAIFTPFHSGTGGSGLGLAVVRRLCDEHGWSLQVRETPGGGATFVVTLPLMQSRGEPAAPAADGRASGTAGLEVHSA